MLIVDLNHNVLDTTSLLDYTAGVDYALINANDPDPTVFTYLDWRIEYLTNTTNWADTPFSHYLLMIGKGTSTRLEYPDYTGYIPEIILEYPFNITIEGEYRIEVFGYAAQGNTDSFFMRLDSGAFQTWHFGQGFGWKTWIQTTFSIGQHSVGVGGREPTGFAAIRVTTPPPPPPPSPPPPPPPSSMECNSEGCWLLVLQYWHEGGTNPPLTVRTSASSTPILAPWWSDVGPDGSTMPDTWGHLSPAALADLQTSTGFTTLRFYAKTSNHDRVIHFKTSDAAVLNYFTTGSGSMEPPIDHFPYSDHTALYVPQAAPDYWNNQGELAMTNL
jgi:hypothetical protein